MVANNIKTVLDKTKFFLQEKCQSFRGKLPQCCDSFPPSIMSSYFYWNDVTPTARIKLFVQYQARIYKTDQLSGHVIWEHREIESA